MWTVEVSRKFLDSKSEVYTLRLDRFRFRIGRGLKNHLILPHIDVPGSLGSIVQKKWRTFWISQRKRVFLWPYRCFVVTGPYRIRVRMSLWLEFVSGAIGSVLLGGLVLFWPAYKGTHPKLETDSLFAEQLLPARGSYGALTSDGPPIRRVDFDFDAAPAKSVVLHFTPGNLIRSDQLAVQINGVSIGFAPICENRWAIEQRLHLPQPLLRKGRNKVSFLHHSESAETAPIWGVRDIYVTFKPISVQEEKSGVDLYRAAKKLYEERASHPGSLARAKELLDRAISTWRAREGAVPSQGLALQRNIQIADDLLISGKMSEARGAIRMRDYERAQEIYEQLLAELIDPTDPRRNSIRALQSEIP